MTSEYSSDNDSTTSSVATVVFDQEDLLQVIQVLLLPTEHVFDLDISRWKDRTVVELIADLHAKMDIEDEYFASGIVKLLNFIDVNRKQVGRRRVKLRLLEDSHLKDILHDAKSN